jgi:hypothetical protein
VHAAESYALAVLENLVHWQTTSLPPKLVCVKVEIPDELEQEEVEKQNISQEITIQANSYVRPKPR